VRLPKSPFKDLRAAALVAGIVAALTFVNSLGNGFAYDDQYIILDNQPVHSLETLPEALAGPYWPGELGSGVGLWRPMATTAYAIQWFLWGEDPTGFHAVNVLLHGVVTALVVLLLGELIPVAGAFVGGMIFAVHAVHVEAVANVVGFAEILAAFFFLWACLLIMRGGEKMGWGRHLAVFLLFALGFLTKESAVTLPGVVLLLDSSRGDLTLKDLGAYLRRRWPLYLGLTLVAGLVLGVRYLVLGAVAKPFAPMGSHLLEEIPRIWTVAASWPHVLRLLFFPMDLVVDYGPDVIPISIGWGLLNVLGVVIVLSCLVLALLSWRRGSLGSEGLSSRALGWGVVWMVITLSPTSNLFFLSGIILSERTLYLPSVGLALALGWLFLRLHQERPRVAVGLVVASIGLLAARSWTRTPTWEDNSAVFTALLNEHPESGRAQWVLGDIHFGLGRKPEAFRAYRGAVRTLDNHYTLLVETGNKVMVAGHERLAEFLFLAAWRDGPESPRAPAALAGFYDRQGRYPEAEKAARGALEVDPTQVLQYHLLSRALGAQGRYPEAMEARRAVMRGGESHRWEQWRWLAELQAAYGDTAAALLSVDSARARASSPDHHRQIDGVLTLLGMAPDTLAERGGSPP